MSTQNPVMVAGGFPVAAVEACIRDALAAQGETQQLLRPENRSSCEPHVDSLVVVELMCAIEQMLGVLLPISFVPRGGYENVESCVSDLISQTRGIWVELVNQEEEHHV